MRIILIGVAALFHLLLLSTDYTDLTNGIRIVGPRLGVAADRQMVSRLQIAVLYSPCAYNYESQPQQHWCCRGWLYQLKNV